MNKLVFKRIVCFIALLFSGSFLWAQSSGPVSTMDQTMRSHDKIFVVMTVCIVILIVFFLYLIRIDMKVSKKEKSI